MWSAKLIWFLTISYEGLLMVESIELEITFLLLGHAFEHLKVLEHTSTVYWSFLAVCSIMHAKLIRKSCYFLEFLVCAIHCIKIRRGLKFVTMMNLV